MNTSVCVPIKRTPSIDISGDANIKPKKLRHASVNKYVQPAQAKPADVSRLQTFLKYNTPCAAGGALLVLTLAAIFQGLGIFITGLVLAGNVALLLWAWRQTIQNNVQRAATAICIGIWVISIFIAFLLHITFVLFPLLVVFSVIVAIPYVDERRLLKLIAGATLLAIVVAPASLFLDAFNLNPYPIEDVIPEWLSASIFSIGLPVTIGLILLLVWQHGTHLSENLTQSKKTNEALMVSEIKLKIMVQELQESRSRIVTIQEGVRQEIAKHLHGRVQGKLLIIKYQLQELVEDSTGISEKTQVVVGAIDDLDQVIDQELSVLSRRLYPTILRQGLIPALETLVDEFEAVLPVDLDLDNGLIQQELTNRNLVPEQIKLAMYRVAEEALTNVVKHAKACQAYVHLTTDSEGNLVLRIKDNGQGFDARESSCGIGMAAIQDYAGTVGGSCTVSSTLGNGTEIIATIPLAVHGAENPQRMFSVV